MTCQDRTARFRLGRLEDVAGIFAVLEEVAPRIPLCLDGDERKELMRKLIQECCESRTSWIALNDGRVVGFQLTRPSFAGRLFQIWGEPQSAGLMLEYGGVSKSFENQGIFRTLIEKTKRAKQPLYATVKENNKSGMAKRLVKMGFENFATDADGDAYFRWRPMATAAGDMGRGV
jgi:hypothetical protein